MNGAAKKCKECEAWKIRYEALERDWRRLHEIDQQWIQLRNIVLIGGIAFAIFFSVGVIVGAI